MAHFSERIQLSPHVEYAPRTGYLWVPMPDIPAPETLLVDGVSFERKPPGSLHCSVLNAARLARTSGCTQGYIVDIVDGMLQHADLEVDGYTGDFFRCVHPDSGVQSLVGAASLRGWGPVAEELRSLVSEDLPDPFPHVTTHTSGAPFGVAIPDMVAFRERCRPLPDEVAHQLHVATKGGGA